MTAIGAVVRNTTLGMFVLLASYHTSSAQGQNDCPAGSADPAAGEVRSVMVRNGSNIHTYYYAVSGGRAIFEGDIVLGSADELDRESKQGPLSVESPGEGRALVSRPVLTGAARWTGATIPYQIEVDTPNIGDVRRAIALWMEKTGVKFVERTQQNAASYKNFVSFQRGTDPNACYSQTLGMLGGQQYVQLVEGCAFGQILHEIGHVIGLNHEQNRSDRDKFVNVLFRNITPRFVYAFVQQPAWEADLGAYDLDSIMHYEPMAFSCNGQPTIVSKSGTPVGQRTHLSAGDIAAVKKIFNLP